MHFTLEVIVSPMRKICGNDTHIQNEIKFKRSKTWINYTENIEIFLKILPRKHLFRDIRNMLHYQV